VRGHEALTLSGRRLATFGLLNQLMVSIPG
jgi:hypothetical protein